MSHDLATYFAFLAGYVVVASGVFFLIWRASRRIASIKFRLVLRAFVLAFLFAPVAAACGGATIAPFAMVVFANIVGLISPNSCGPYTPWNLVSFLLTFAIVAIALAVLDRLRHH
jgi:hypothetical protein